MVRWIILVICLLCVTACKEIDVLQLVTTQETAQDIHVADTKSEREKCELVRVVDGDTLVVLYEGIEVKVRLIGVDTPESVHSDKSKNTEFGSLASEYTKFLLQDEEFVYLEFDEAKMDDYGRYLAYVYLSNDSNFSNSLNYVLIESGFAINREYPPNVKYATELSDACLLAKEKKAGLWQEENIGQIWEE